MRSHGKGRGWIGRRSLMTAKRPRRNCKRSWRVTRRKRHRNLSMGEEYHKALSPAPVTPGNPRNAECPKLFLSIHARPPWQPPGIQEECPALTVTDSENKVVSFFSGL